MLEFFRRHRGAFLIVLTIIIILSFSVWGGWNKTMRGAQAGPSDSAFSIYGKDYTFAEMDRFQRYYQLAYMLGLYDLAQGLTSVVYQYQTRDQFPVDFVFNLLVLRKEMKENGIQPSDDDAKAELQKLPSLQNNGVFDPARANMVEQNLGAMGFNSGDLLQIMKDRIGLEKLRSLVGGNYTPSPVVVEKLYASRYQTLKTSTIAFNLDDFKKQAQVSDDEVKKYYEEKKDTMKTPEKRAVDFVFFEEPKDLDKLDAEKRIKAQNEFGNKVNQFNSDSLKPGAKLAELATKAKVQVQSIPAFEQANPPEVLKAESAVVDAIFNTNFPSHPIGDPVKGTKGYYIFQVTGVTEPQQEKLEDVKTKIKDLLITQKAQEAMTKAANETRTALYDGLKAGKKIEELAKEKKLTLTAQPEFAATTPPQDMASGYEIAREAEKTPAGQVSKPVSTDKGMLIVYVNAKELRKREDSATLRKNMADSMTQAEQFQLFKSWFSKKRDAAKLAVHFPATV